jgi:type IV secretory pathway VirB10-like protein
MQRARWRWTLLAAVLIPLSGLCGQLYKWVDANGKVHYSDQPPPSQGVKQQSTLQNPRAATPAALAPPAEGAQAAAAPSRPKTAAELDMEFRKRRLEAAEAEAKRQQEAQAKQEKQRNCEQAKARVATLQNGGRITRSSASGEQVYLDDAEIARELVEARKTADSWCNG